MRTSEHTVTADHHQFIIYSHNPPTEAAIFPEGIGDGLAMTSSSLLKIHTGTNYGPVSVRIDLHDEEPGLPSDEWTEVSDLSFQVHAGPLELGTLMGGPEPDSPDLAFAGPGPYRIRISAQGRDHGRSGSGACSGNQKERFLIAIWKAPAAAPETLRRSDLTGRSFRGELFAEKLDAAIEFPALSAFHALLELLRPGSPAAAATRSGIELAISTTSPPDEVAKTLSNRSFWPSWLGDGGVPDLHGRWITRFSMPADIGIEGVPTVDAHSVTTTWDYTRRTTPSQEDPFPRYEPVFSTPTTVTVSWAHGADGTDIGLRHDKIPEPLISCMTDLWRYYLARLAQFCESGLFGHHPWP